MNEINGYIRKEVGPHIFHIYNGGLVVMLEKRTLEAVGSWSHPKTDAPAFVRKALELNYAPEFGTVTECFSFAPKVKFDPIPSRIKGE
jgi:hypothetical protein